MTIYSGVSVLFLPFYSANVKDYMGKLKHHQMTVFRFVFTWSQPLYKSPTFPKMQSSVRAVPTKCRFVDGPQPLLKAMLL
ncbi:hypothetical protein COB55_03365 [Candidatus Wolfebacteria bacterium]|nr:MAG: hypothetical protein COB55_03365 [Candidatus Wolfebacteria bacterium]